MTSNIVLNIEIVIMLIAYFDCYLISLYLFRIDNALQALSTDKKPLMALRNLMQEGN